MKRQKILQFFLLTLITVFVFSVTGCSAEKKILKNFELSDAEITLMTGQTKTLVLTDLGKSDVGEFSVRWHSDKPELVSVDEDGNIAALTEGSCTVSAIVKTKKNEVKFPCKVTVKKNTIAVTGLAFKASIYALGEGQTKNLKQELVAEPADAALPELIWTSTNPSIATVTDGVVTPVSTGISTIIATTPDGFVQCSCTVQVSGIKVEATGITLEDDMFTINIGQTITIPYKITPENATGYSLTWTSSDDKVVSIAGSAVTGKAEGQATVTARLKMGNVDTTVKCTVTVEGRSAEVPAERISLTPNSITLSADDRSSQKFQVTVEPINHTQTVSWTTNREDIIDLNGRTGEFKLKSSPKEMTAAVITCSVGNLSTTGVVLILPGTEAEMDVSKLTLYTKPPKNTQKLSVEWQGEIDVTWKSSDPKIATVDDKGNVTALKTGKCKITASFQTDTAAYTATCEVTVEEAPYLSLKVGDTAKITLPEDFDPAKELSWNGDKDVMSLDLKTLTVTALKPTDEEIVSFQVSYNGGNLSCIFNIYIMPAGGQ